MANWNDNPAFEATQIPNRRIDLRICTCLCQLLERYRGFRKLIIPYGASRTLQPVCERHQLREIALAPSILHSFELVDKSSGEFLDSEERAALFAVREDKWGQIPLNAEKVVSGTALEEGMVAKGDNTPRITSVSGDRSWIGRS